MKCTWTYKNHTFQNEMQLDDFLLEKEKFYSKYGDIVFNSSPYFLEQKAKLEKLHEDSINWKKELEANPPTYIEGERLYHAQKPYIGVNDYYKNLTNAEGKLIQPYFDDKEYWDRRIEAWTVAEFTDDEKELFFDDFSQIQPIAKKDSQQYVDMMVDKWKSQALCGDQIHKVMQLFFTKLKSGANQGKIAGTLNDDFLINVYLKGKLDQKYINPTAVRQTVQLARKLYNQIITKYGECEFYPEFTLMGKAADGTPLLGRIDLLFLDEKGNTHIVDYKTSPHPYDSHGSIKGYSSAKKLSLIYQVASYQRLLEQSEFDITNGDMMVVPIQLQNFRESPSGFIYDGIKLIKDGDDKSAILYYSLKNQIENSYSIQSNLNDIFPPNTSTSVSTSSLIENTETLMKSWFHNYNHKEYTQKQVIDELKALDAFTPNNGIYRVTLENREFVAKSEAELVKKVLRSKNNEIYFTSTLTHNVINGLKEAIKNKESYINLPPIKDNVKVSNPNWFNDVLHQYLNGDWEVIENDSLSNYGIFLLKNKYTGQIDVKKISTRGNLNYRPDDGTGQKLLSSSFIKDSIEDANPSSLMLERLRGNIELIEALAVLNNTQGLFTKGTALGSIEVMSPQYGKGLTASNEELIYTFNRMCKLSKSEIKEFNPQIRVCNKFQLALNKFHDIMTSGASNNWTGDFNPFKTFDSCLSNLDSSIDQTIPLKIKALQDLLSEMENKDEWSKALKTFNFSQDVILKNYQMLYRLATIALADLQGVTFRQQSKAHQTWIESVIIWKEGVQSLMFDSPGQLASKTLNTITNQTTIAYQNVRESMQHPAAKIHNLVKAVEKDRGSDLSGNRASLFMNLYSDNKQEFSFKFLDDPTLYASEKALLKYCLRAINKNRFDISDVECERRERIKDPEYFRVPLAIGGSESRISTDGLIVALKDKLKAFKPENVKERLEYKMKEVNYAEQTGNLTNSSSDLFSMGTMFDWGEGSNRADVLQNIVAKHGSFGFLEHNLETLTLKHIFAYSVKENIDKVFPMMKAAAYHLAYQGLMQNTQFEGDMDYMEKYIKSRVKNEPIVDKNLQMPLEYMNAAKGAASYLVLAFSPVQTLYQSLQGIWTDIRLILQKPDVMRNRSDSAFTLKNISAAFTSAYRDLFAFGDTNTVNGLINQVYGLNDMDMNSYVEHIQTQEKGIFNFWKWGMKFSSRPDYYNRLTIFGAQMRHDGCWDAHSVKDGELVYDWRKDKRFELFANDRNINSEEYEQQRALYYAMCKQFVNEHAKNPDGTDFVYEYGKKVALPKAYTVKQSESLKSLADDIYGYYSHEKKSLFNSIFLGSLYMQFKTFWTGKKNQYLAQGAEKLRGEYVQKVDDEGNKLYYKLDSNGIETDELTTENTHHPVLEWKGQWQEGIFLTLSHALGAGSFKSVLKEFYNQWMDPDLNKRNAYRSNYIQLGFDCALWLLIAPLVAAGLADWLKELKEESKTDPQPLKLAAANIAVKSVNSSLMDFNIWDSAGKPITQWTPFSFEFYGRTVKNLWNTILGDKDAWDFALNFTSATRVIKPGLDLLKPESEE